MTRKRSKAVINTAEIHSLDELLELIPAARPGQLEAMKRIYAVLGYRGLDVLDKIAALGTVLLSESVKYLDRAPTREHEDALRDVMKTIGESLVQYSTTLEAGTATEAAVAMGHNQKKH